MPDLLTRLSRRRLLRTAAACTAVSACGLPLLAVADGVAAESAETLAGRLHASLTPEQRQQVGRRPA